MHIVCLNEYCSRFVQCIFCCGYTNPFHYNDVIMSALASQITSFAVVCSTVYSSSDQWKHQSSAPLAFVRGIHRWPVNSLLKGPVTRKINPLDDVIMISPVFSRITSLLPGNLTRYDIIAHMSMRWSWTITATSNDRHGVSNYRSVGCLFISLFILTTKKHQRSALLSLCEGNPPVTDGFPAQMDGNAENVSTWRDNDIGPRMITSSNGNIFRVTGPLCGELIDHRWIPLTKACDTELWCFFLSVSE